MGGNSQDYIDIVLKMPSNATLEELLYQLFSWPQIKTEIPEPVKAPVSNKKPKKVDEPKKYFIKEFSTITIEKSKELADILAGVP